MSGNSGSHSTRKRTILTEPGIILLGVLLLMFVVIFVWWPTDVYWNGVALVGWIMFATIPVSIALTGIYVVWMERLEQAAGKDVDEAERVLGQPGTADDTNTD